MQPIIVAHGCSSCMRLVESVPTFSLLSSWQNVLADFEEMARLTVEEKNMILSVLDFMEQERERNKVSDKRE